MHIKIESTEDFFNRGKTIASLADKGLLEKESKIVSFEHAEDLAKSCLRINTPWTSQGAKPVSHFLGCS